MIAEFIKSWLTPAPKWARRMGYVREAVAIEARAKRCHAVWAPHLDKTKAAILDAVTGRKQNRTVLIVGSGACLDIPLAELAEIFERVVLVDIVHPLKSKTHGHDNVLQVTLDITGMMQDLYKNPHHLPEVKIVNSYHDFPDIDFVLSVNVASQLVVMPFHYAGCKLTHDDVASMGFAKKIIQAHLTWLSGFKCPGALICDRSWERLDPVGKLIDADDPLYGNILPNPVQDWYWDVAPIAETAGGFACRNRVGYWPNFQFTASDDISASSISKSTESI